MNVGLYASVQGLLTAQRNVDVASHNISNSETEGFSRQRVSQAANTPQSYGGVGQVGTGVQISSINRIRDTLIDRQIRQQSAPLGESTVRAEALGQIEDILSEPTDGALTAKLANYYDAWQKLSANPENASLRVTLREAAANLATTFNRLSTDLQAVRQDLYDRVGTVVADINSKAKQIAELNGQIGASIASGQNPNDLKDQQDLLIEQLSSLVNIQAVESATSGQTNVFIGGDPLVFMTDAFTFSQATINPLTDNATVTFGPTGLPASITSGSLKGLLDVRNQTLGVLAPLPGKESGLLYQLNTLASQIISDTNSLHTQGFGLDGTTTLNFFNGSNAGDIVVNQNITNLANGLDFIAAAANDPGSLAGGPGDNGMAILIAQRRNSLTMGATAPIPPAVVGTPATQSFETFWKQQLSDLAVKSQTASRTVATQETLVASVKERRDQVSAVSTDEEMANVIRFQKAYAASARMISVIDEMLDTLINIGR